MHKNVILTTTPAQLAEEGRERPGSLYLQSLGVEASLELWRHCLNGAVHVSSPSDSIRLPWSSHAQQHW
ncbi:hypothetical protein E2C01_043447 [Portunus trituberculatus]|uniref:Uncharacterized protein n=1 Tax=Portunus trituberculatus TaxID=210409 RepID=A0A5B7FXL4_PORTR|nr:hypothetical protein [Portunus trituberculatus]